MSINYSNERIKELVEECKEIESKHGYYYHYMTDSERPNIHTHGLLRNFGFIELESLIIDGTLNKSVEILEFVIDHIKNETLTNIKNNDLVYHEKYGNLVFKLFRDEFGYPIYRVIPVDEFLVDSRVFTKEDQDNNERILNY